MRTTPFTFESIYIKRNNVTTMEIGGLIAEKSHNYAYSLYKITQTLPLSQVYFSERLPIERALARITLIFHRFCGRFRLLFGTDTGP
jgi:hypothetical protein